MPATHPDPRRGVPRRQVLGAAGIALLAAGCAADSTSSQPRATGGVFPATVRHTYGSATIPKRPRRVVTVGLTEQDYVLALGVRPVAAREWFGDQPGALWPWARRELGDRSLPAVLPRQQLDFEQIAALRPDVILGVNSGLTRDEYDKLSRIAPTVAQPQEHADFGAPWQEITRIIGRVLGERERARRLVSGIEKRFEQMRSDHSEFDGSTGLLATSIDGSAYVYAEGPAPRFLSALGLRLPQAVADLFSGDDREPVQLSLEKLGVLDHADVLVLGVYGDRSSSVATKSVYKSLDVARQGRDVVLPRMSRLNGALSFSSVLSLPLALDEVVPRLAAAIDADPTTTVRPAPTSSAT